MDKRSRATWIIIGVIISAILVFNFTIIFSYLSPKEWAIWNGKGEMPNANLIVSIDDGIERNGDFGLGTASGTLMNKKKHMLNYVQVSIGLYVDGAKVGSCFDNQSNIAGGGSWKFKAICTNVPQSNFNYRVDDVTSW